MAIAGLILVALWDLSGWDLTVTSWYANAHGFSWRDRWLARTVLHDGGHWLSIGAWVLLLAHTVLPKSRSAQHAMMTGPSRCERLYWLGVVILSALTISGLKQLSSTSCPWELTQFGGHARYISHWLIGVSDGGSGHCFPSGHASSAFAFFGLYFLWRPYRPQRARRILRGLLILGGLFSWAQLVRGAHFLSHSLWTAWVCWAISTAALALRRQQVQKNQKNWGQMNISKDSAAKHCQRDSEVSRRPEPAQRCSFQASDTNRDKAPAFLDTAGRCARSPDRSALTHDQETASNTSAGRW